MRPGTIDCSWSDYRHQVGRGVLLCVRMVVCAHCDTGKKYFYLLLVNKHEIVLILQCEIANS